MKFLVVLAVLCFCVVGYCDDSLWRYVSAPEPLNTVFDPMFSFLMQQESKESETKTTEETKTVSEQKGELVEETQRKVITGVGGYTPHPIVYPTFGIKFSGLMPLSARTETPDAGFALGLVLRFPVHPGYWRGRVELASAFSVTSMGLNNVQGGVTYDEVYESYWDITVAYLGHFIPYPELRNMYWGIGFGMGEETVTYKKSGVETSEDNSTSSFVFKLGWDSYINFYFELSYRRLLDSNRNISDMLEFCFGLYF
jgi:hypothetical protein